MAGSVDLIIRIISDTKKAAADIESAGSKVSGFASGVKKAAVPAAIALAGIAAGAATAAASASRTEQAMGGLESVFGDSADQMKKWADGAAKSAGLAKSEYGELATVIGSQLKNAGLPMDEVVTQTDALIKKGADLAAMFGGTTADAVSALSSVMKGETDPIEAYGVSIKQADIAAQKAKMGTEGLTGAAGKQADAMAALALVNAQTADAQGKFASESDTAAGSSAIMQAQLENMKSELGTALLPILAQVSSALATVFGFMADHTTTVQILAIVIATVAAAILVLNVALTLMAIAETVALAPILLIVLAVIALIVVIVLIVKHFDTLKAVAVAVWDAIKSAAATVWAAIKSGASAALAFVLAAWNAIKAGFDAVFNWIKSAWGTIAAILTGPVGIAVGIITNNWNKIKTAFHSAIDGITSAWDTCISGLKSAVSGLGAILSAPFSAAQSAIQWVIDKVNALISALGRIHVPSINLPGPFSLPGAAETTPTPTGRVAAPGVPIGRASGGSTSGAVVINVTGAIDPEATARQIRRILAGHDRRVGLVS